MKKSKKRQFYEFDNPSFENMRIETRGIENAAKVLYVVSAVGALFGAIVFLSGFTQKFLPALTQTAGIYILCAAGIAKIIELLLNAAADLMWIQYSSLYYSKIQAETLTRIEAKLNGETKTDENAE